MVVNINYYILLSFLLLSGYLAFSKRLKNSSNWKAMVTPLASIMGSGFLVSAPLLAGIVGVWAVFCMSILLIIAYAVGSAIRFNIQYFEPIEHQEGVAQSIAFISRIVLAGAYFISVTYYLQLLAAFALKSFGIQHEIYANIITTILLLLIGGVGMYKGLQKLEQLETYAISLNLGMIGSLILGLIIYNSSLAIDGNWHLPEISSLIDFNDIRVLLGLLIVVQGFETSRYLGDEHPSSQRITTMKQAQLLSAGIYIVFISLATVLFHDGLKADVTAIISMIAPVAITLPILVAIAAIGSQFSAAVADNSAAGGLIEEITKRKLPLRYAYGLIMFITIALTWETNVNTIIAYASRAFALFYMLQSLVALITAYNNKEIENRTFKIAQFTLVAIICLLVFVLGIPAE